jgi:hypothetical protein
MSSRKLLNTNMTGGDDYEYKAKKYHYKIQNVLKQMIANGQSCPPGHAKYLKPFGATMHGGGDDEDYFRRKAEKYHYKIQQKLNLRMADGAKCPAGYEQYLKPFSG